MTVSIVMPTFNRAVYLPECIESILAQTYTDWELITVDDGSTDSTYQIMDYYTKMDPRIRYFKRKHQGIAKTRNEALRLASGDFIAVMDSDDIMTQDRLKLSLKELEKTGADVFYSAYARADEHGQIQDAIYTADKITPKSIKDNLGVMPHVTVMAKAKCFKIHPYREYLTSNDDLALTIDWYKAGYKFCSSKKPLVLVRYHNQSTSKLKDKEIKKFTKQLLKELDEK